MTTQDTYTKGQAIRVDGKPGYTYNGPCSLYGCQEHDVTSPDGFDHVKLSRIAPEPTQGNKPTGKSLGTIANEVSVNACKGTGLTCLLAKTPEHIAAWEAIAQAVRTAVLADTGQVFVTAERKPTEADSDGYGVFVFHLYDDPSAHKRPGGWYVQKWSYVADRPETHTHWMKIPAMPAAPEPSEKEIQLADFEKWQQSSKFSHHGSIAMEAAWIAGIEYQKELQKL